MTCKWSLVKEGGCMDLFSVLKVWSQRYVCFLWESGLLDSGSVKVGAGKLGASADCGGREATF